MVQQFLYVLELKDGYYYVGKSGNVDERFEKHVQGDGGCFTRIHMPIKIVEEKEYDMFDEDKYVKKYMMMYGIDKVRGGIYVQLQLSEEVKNRLKKEFWHEKNLCMRCGRSDHWIMQCDEVNDIDGIVIVDDKIINEKMDVKNNLIVDKRIRVVQDSGNNNLNEKNVIDKPYQYCLNLVKSYNDNVYEKNKDMIELLKKLGENEIDNFIKSLYSNFSLRWQNCCGSSSNGGKTWIQCLVKECGMGRDCMCIELQKFEFNIGKNKVNIVTGDIILENLGVLNLKCEGLEVKLQKHLDDCDVGFGVEIVKRSCNSYYVKIKI